MAGGRRTVGQRTGRTRLQDAKRSFCRSVRFANELLSKLHYDGAIVTDVRPAQRGGPTWFLRVQLPKALRERFALAPEILMVVTRSKLAGRDLDGAEEQLQEHGGRLDRDIVLVVDPSPDLAGRLELLPRAAFQAIPWDEPSSLLHVFTRWLPRHDLFDFRDPVRGDEVLGRDKDIAGLRQEVLTSGATGVFGLRKSGKSTLVRAVTDRLVETERDELGLPETAVAWGDAEQFLRPGPGALSTQWLDELVAHTDVEVELPSDPLEALDAWLRWWLKAERRRLVLVLDEFDVLLAPDTAAGMRPLFALLRAWSQRTGRVHLVLIGRDPVALTQPTLGGIANPMLGWVRSHWVAPLERSAGDKLLTYLGRRVGLEVGRKTLDCAWDLTGGHVLLHRLVGSVALELALSRRGTPTTALLSDEVLDALAERWHLHDGVRNIRNEVRDLIGSRYPTTAEVLAGAVSEAGVLATADSEVLEVAARFGLVDAHHKMPGWVIRTFASRRQGVAA